jgi:hypothetical protein
MDLQPRDRVEVQSVNLTSNQPTVEYGTVDSASPGPNGVVVIKLDNGSIVTLHQSTPGLRKL